MKPIKAIVAAAAALTITCAPATSPIAKPADVSYAASATAGKSRALNIPDSDIQVSISRKTYGGGGAINVSAGRGWSKSGSTYVSTASTKSAITTGWLDRTKLSKTKFYYTVKVPSKYTEDDIRNNLTIDLEYQNSGHSNGGMTLGNRSKINVTEVKNEGGYKTFNVNALCSVYGEKVKINLVFSNSGGSYTFRNERVELSGFATSDGDIGYTRADATYANGESIHLLFDKKDQNNNWGLSTEELRVYMRTLCRLMNSLSDITGIKHKDIYVMFDEDQTGSLQCNHFVMSSDGTTATVMIPRNLDTWNAEPGLISFYNGVENNQLDWGLMHELAHCYSFTSQDKRFARAYNSSVDDTHTNARGVVALQNCLQTRDVQVVFNGHNVGNYKTALNNAKIFANEGDPFFEIADFFGRYGNQIDNGWIKLETYFGGVYGNPNIINSVVYGAQEAIDQYSSYWWYNENTFKTADTYRFINSIYYLGREAASNGYGATKNDFKKFIRNFVGANVFTKYIVEKTNISDLGEASVSRLKGDLDLDGKITSADVTLGNKYFADNYSVPDNGLTPEGAFNFDTNSDGYINQEDLNYVKNHAK